MSVRIPIIEQQSSTGYVPIGPVSAVQVDDARPKAMQGLAGAIGEVGEMISARQKKADDQAAAKAAAQAAANDASSIKEQEDTKAWTMDSYASCVAQAADLDTQVQGGGSDSSNGAAAAAADAAGGAASGTASGTSSGAASGFPGGLGQFLRTPTLDQILGGALPGLSGAQASQPGAAGVIGSALGGVTGGAGSAGGEAAAPHPLDVQTHGQTGAWANGYDLIAAERVGAAPNEQARQAIAAQCSLDRARGVGQVMAREALGNVQARESGFARSVGIIAARRLAQDPGALGEMLTFTRQNMIRVGAGRQAAFEARMENMLIGTAVQAEAGRDPEGLVAALAQRAGEKANSGAQEGSANPGAAQEGVAATQGEVAPEGAAAHPIASALTPAQARAWLPRAQAGLEIARTNQRAEVQQSYDTALRDIAASGDASRLPSEAQLIATHGAEQGKLMAAQAAKAIEERELYGNLRASPSTTLHDMLGEEQDALDREAQAATAAGTANGNAPVNAAASALSAPASPPSVSRRAIERILRERERDPMQAALDTGGYGLAALDVSSAQAAQQGLLARIAPSAQVSGQYGTQRRLFTDTEAPKVASLVQALPGEEQAQWLRDLIGGANDGQAVQDALRELSPHAPALAMAGRLMLREQGASGDPYQWGGAGTINAADQITSGAALIKEDKANLPPDQETRRAFRIGIGETFADQPGEEAMRYDAMLAAYAGLSQRAGDATGKFDQRRWEAAEYLVNFGSGTDREVGLVEDVNQPHSDSEGEPAIPADNMTPEKLPEARTVGKEGVEGAWGIAKQLAGEGATKAQINRIKNQLLFLNPELSSNVMEGQKYYVPDKATPEQDNPSARRYSSQEHSASPQSGREMKAANGRGQNPKSAPLYSDSDPIPLLRNIESANGLQRGDLDYAENDPRRAETVKVWSSGKFGAPEVHQVQGGGVLAEKIERENLYGKLGVKAHDFMRIIRAGQEQIDSDRYQNAASSSYHAMSSPEDIQQDIRKGLPSGSTAKERANREVRNHMELSWKALDKGDYEAAYRYFAFALHTMQDSTSPEHFGFKQWRDPPSKWRHPIEYAKWARDGIAHGASEMYPPGENSNFAKATRDAMDWLLTRKMPEGDLFSRYGMDRPPEKSPLTGKDRFIERHLGRDGR